MEGRYDPKEYGCGNDKRNSYYKWCVGAILGVFLATTPYPLSEYTVGTKGFCLVFLVFFIISIIVCGLVKSLNYLILLTMGLMILVI